MSMRYFLLSIVTFIVGYVAGIIFGYRSAVVDYVENDAATIQEMADSMYDEVDEDDLPEELQNLFDESADAKGFQ